MTPEEPPELTSEKKLLQSRIREMQEQHRELDSAIHELLLESTPDELRIKRMKKEKLQRKDEIAKLEDMLFPDIIA